MTVVVLGHRLTDETAHPELQARVETGVELFQESETDRIVCSGGSANEKIDITEAEVMKEYAVSLGVDPTAVVRENNSIDTIGNAFYTRLLLDGLDTDPVIDIATSCYHVDRARLAFEQICGDQYDVRTTSCADIGEGAQEATKRAATEAFFNPVESGSLPEIRERLLDAHTLYDSLPEVDP